MKTLLIISFSNLATDPRVSRQIRLLKDHYQIITIGLGDPKLEGVKYIDILAQSTNLFRKSRSAIRLLTGYYEQYYWSKPEILYLLDKIKSVKKDVILVNDIDPLPVAIKSAEATEVKIIFDAHEYAPREYEDRWQFRVFQQRYKTYLCHKYIPKVNKMITVCQSIADIYEKDTTVKPVVITNAPDYVELKPRLISKNQKIQLVHHGGAAPSRRIDKMIEIMNYLNEKFELNLILVGGKTKYMNYLKSLAVNKQNIRFLDPVPMRELPQYLNQFDIGIYILEPNSLNNRLALPNKLFEFIQGRLAIAIGPSPEMARVVKTHDCGIVAEDFDPKTLAQKLMALDYEQINYYKQRSHEVAKLLSAETNKEILLNLVREVLDSNETESNPVQ